MFKEELSKWLKEQLKHDISLEVPPDSLLGDYAIPCFPFAKTLKFSPVAIAKEFKEQLKTLPDYIERIDTKGPYLNFYIKKEELAKKVLEVIAKEKDSFGSLHQGKNKKVIIEHTSINPNASPHLGRARNALIGDGITRLLRFVGFTTNVHYYINDMGKQIAMLALAIKGKKDISFNDLLSEYVSITKKMEKDASIEKEVFSLLKKYEDNDKITIDSFKKVVDICVKGQMLVLNGLDIHFDTLDYESQHLQTEKTLQQLEKTKKVFVDEHKRKVLDLKDFDLPMKEPVCVLTRANGSSLYIMRDIVYTNYKISKHADRNIVVLGEDHTLYFKQLQSILSLLKKDSPEAIFYSFVLLKEGKMSTRKGQVVLLESFLDEAKDKARKVLENKGIAKNKDILATHIANGAIRFSILKVAPQKNIVFSLERALSFEGDTSLYAQYTHARAATILRKSTKKPSSSVKSLNDKDFALIKKLQEFPEIVNNALQHVQLHSIASFILELSREFNEYYHSQHVIGTTQEEERLSVVKATKQTLKNALGILGIHSPEEM